MRCGARGPLRSERKRKSESLDPEGKKVLKKAGYSGDGGNMSWKDEEGQKMLAALIDLRRLQRIEHSQKARLFASYKPCLSPICGICESHICISLCFIEELIIQQSLRVSQPRKFRYPLSAYARRVG